MATDAIVAIQDMGAAGLTSSSVEMAGKGGVGIELDLDQVPPRETGMTAYEIHAVGKPGAHADGAAPGPRGRRARRSSTNGSWTFAVIGHLTDTGRIVVRHHGVVEADIPLAPLNDQAPLYTAPPPRPAKQTKLNPARIEDRLGLARALEKLVACPDLCSRAWVWDQYDSTSAARP